MQVSPLHQAGRIADYVAPMHLGSLLEFGPVDDVMQWHRDPRAKDYLGSRRG